MHSLVKKCLTIVAILIVAGLAIPAVSGPITSAFTPHTTYDTPYGTFQVPDELLKGPDNLTLYKVTPQPGDMAFFSVTNPARIRSNITSAEKAPAVAGNYIGRYGGLPPDAGMVRVKENYATRSSRNLVQFFSSGESVKYPVSTTVRYARVINGHGTVGYGGFIDVELGENNELLFLEKNWRTITPAGKARIISAEEALRKVQLRQILSVPPRDTGEFTVTQMVPTYYERGLNESQEYLDPVWVIQGNYIGGPWQCLVYAWRFADFTESSSASAPMTLQFNDTSQATANHWEWNFGDGTIAEEQNPVHTYVTAGYYPVTLTAGNGLGNDTVSRVIHVGGGTV